MAASRGPLGRLLAVLVLVGLVCLLGACDRKDQKLSVEEAGYMDEIAAALAAVERVGTSHMESHTSMITEIRYTTTYEVRHLPTGQWEGRVEALRSLQPPAGLESLHEQLLEAIDYQLKNEKAMTSKNGEYEQGTPVGAESTAMIRTCARVKGAHKAFADGLAARPDQPVSKDAIGISYKPPLIPLSASVSTKGFGLECSPSLDTPVGSFGVFRKETAGVRKLTLLSEGKRRVLRLDRPFRLFVPTEYGISIASAGESDLTVEVVRRPAGK